MMSTGFILPREERQTGQEALRDALEQARQKFSKPQIHVIASMPVHYPGLQVADYFLWALQRFYERREDRFVELLWPSFRLVHDIDDTRVTKYGTYYTQKKPLTIAALPKMPGI